MFVAVEDVKVMKQRKAKLFERFILTEVCDPRLAEKAGLEERQKSSLQLFAERKLAAVFKEPLSDLFSLP